MKKAYYYQGPYPIATPRFQFDRSTSAAGHNFNVLKDYNFNLADALSDQNDTPLHVGSEFKPLGLIELLLNSHPLWNFTLKLLQDGATYHLHKISDIDRKQDLTFALSRGNQKSVISNKPIMKDLLFEDITRGFSLSLPLRIVSHLQNISNSPLGCQQQDTINENGEIILKNCLTYDQSFPGPSGISTNLCGLSDQLPPCKYGNCLKQIINYIISIHLRHPSILI